MQDVRSSRRLIKGLPDLLDVYAPLQLNGRRVGTARIGLEIEEASRLIKRNQVHIFFSMALMIGGAVFAVVLFYRIQNRHLRRLQEMRERLNQAERLSSLGRLAAGVAHEIRNPLNAISMAIQRIHREFGPPETESNKEFSHLVTVVREEIRSLNRSIEDFLGPIQERHTESRMERLVDLLERVVLLEKEEAGSRNVQIQCQWEDPDLMIYMDAARMHQAVLNLIKNAVESIVGHGTIIISAHPHGPHMPWSGLGTQGSGSRQKTLSGFSISNTPPKKKAWVWVCLLHGKSSRPMGGK